MSQQQVSNKDILPYGFRKWFISDQEHDKYIYFYRSSVMRVLVRAATQEKEIQGIKISNKEIKLSICEW